MENKNPQEFLEELCNLCKKHQIEIYIPSFANEFGDHEEMSMSFNWSEVTNLIVSPYRASMGVKETKEYSFERPLTPALSLSA